MASFRGGGDNGDGAVYPCIATGTVLRNDGLKSATTWDGARALRVIRNWNWYVILRPLYEILP